MSSSRLQGLILVLVALVVASGASDALGVPVTPQSGYFNYNGVITPLVGVSAEYIPHIDQPDKNQSYATWANHQSYIDTLAAAGLNKIRIWIGVNHSPGTASLTYGQVYPNEQPYAYSNGKWNLDLWNPVYFSRLHSVVSYCRARGIIVEVTLFEPWSGDWLTGPWYSGKNFQMIGFQERKHFVSFDTAGGHTKPENIAAYARQLALVDKIVFELVGYDNVIWEIANEPDINGGNGVSSETVEWHKAIATRIRNAENNNWHTVAAHLSSGSSFAAMQPPPCATPPLCPNRAPTINVFNGHYVDLNDSTRYAAIEMSRNSVSLGVDGFVLGFNEGKITPIQTTAESMRAEAWEFMLSRGGSFDHFGVEWQQPMAGTVRSQLAKLLAFLRSLNLQNLSRDLGSQPIWMSGLPAYGSASGGSKRFWGAMHWPGNQYVLYLHRSNISGEAFRRYLPALQSNPVNYYQSSFQVNLGSSSGTFRVEWIAPESGSVLSSSNVAWSGSGWLPLTSPPYAFDIALRIRRVGTF